MKIDFQRAVDRWVGGPLCGALSLVERLRPRRPPRGDPKNILMILLSEMGSLVLARPMLERLRERFPDARMHALVFAQNREVLDLQGIVPPENVVTLRNDGLLHLLTDSRRALKTLRAQGIDTVLDLELFARISSIYSYLSGARVRVGFYRHTQEGLYRGSFINRRVLYNPYQHMAQQFLTLAEAIPSDASPPPKRLVGDRPRALPPVELAAGEVDAMRDRLLADFPRLEGRKLVLFSPAGGLLPIRAWPLEAYEELGRALLEDGHALGVIGLARDRDVAQDLAGRLGQELCLDLTGYTRSVRELMVLFHLSALMVANDGGPGHFAAMTPMPAIVFFGPETPTLYGTIDDTSLNMHTNLSCSPCLTAYNHRKSPCDGDNVCLQLIQPPAVLKEARRRLERGAVGPLRRG